MTTATGVDVVVDSDREEGESRNRYKNMVEDGMKKREKREGWWRKNRGVVVSGALVAVGLEFGVGCEWSSDLL